MVIHSYLDESEVNKGSVLFKISFPAVWNLIVYQYYITGVSKTLCVRTTELCSVQV